MTVFKLIHLLAALVWVGGLFFSYVVLRPAAVEVLQPPERLRLWNAVFRRFFNLLWSVIGAVLITGLYMIYQNGGLAQAPHFIHLMLILGVFMTAVFCYVFFACFVPFSLHISKERWKEAASILSKIRHLVALNLILGVSTIIVAKVGMLWG